MKVEDEINKIIKEKIIKIIKKNGAEISKLSLEKEVARDIFAGKKAQDILDLINLIYGSKNE